MSAENNKINTFTWLTDDLKADVFDDDVLEDDPFDGLSNEEIYDQLKSASIDDKNKFRELITNDFFVLNHKNKFGVEESYTICQKACAEDNTHIVNLLLEWNFLDSFRKVEDMVCLVSWFSSLALPTFLLVPEWECFRQ